MPRPHFPVQGGAHAQPRHGVAMSSDSTGSCDKCREKAAEIDRLRQQLAHARNGDSAGVRPRLAAAGMVWMALGICGIGLLFALAAVMRHG